MSAPTNLFVFAIPLMPRQRAGDWHRVLGNLRATLRSVLNQTDPNFLVIIATSDSIDLPELRDPRIQILPVPQNNAVELEADSQPSSMRDKLYKQGVLATHANALGAGYLMQTDADDLVSNRLVAFVRVNPHPAGYAIRQGYAMDQASAKILPCPSKAIQVDGFDTYCGTSIILTLGAAANPNAYGPDFVAGMNHHVIRSTMMKSGHPLLDIEAPMAVYLLNTGENITRLAGNMPEHIDFFHDVTMLVRAHGVAMTEAQREEFGLAASR